jgi:hypothetical protein
VQLVFTLAAAAQRTAAPIAQTTQTFTISFDLWEERFAVSRAGTPPRSISHLTARAAEAWCLENLTVPAAPIARLGADAPFWIRLEYRGQNPAVAAEANGDTTLTLGKLIDVLSRRRPTADVRRSVEAGPLRLPR